MKRIKYYTCDVFTDTVFGGNQLAVIPDAASIDDRTMQAIAREFNYSETTFVTPPADSACDFRVRIFTPTRELPFAGHPTLGTAHVLSVLGRIKASAGQGSTRGEGEIETVFEEGVGAVPVSIRLDADGAPVFASLRIAKPVEFGESVPDESDLAAALGLERADIGCGEWRPAALSVGFPFLMIPLRDAAAVGRARLDQANWQRKLCGGWAADLYVFAPVAGGKTDGDLHVRMFGPSVGVPEDPATGSAAVTLAAYLAHFEPDYRDRKEIGFERRVFQGAELGRPSVLTIRGRKSGGRTREFCVGGPTVMVAAGEMSIPG